MYFNMIGITQNGHEIHLFKTKMNKFWPTKKEKKQFINNMIELLESNKPENGYLNFNESDWAIFIPQCHNYITYKMFFSWC